MLCYSFFSTIIRPTFQMGCKGTASFFMGDNQGCKSKKVDNKLVVNQMR